MTDYRWYTLTHPHPGIDPIIRDALTAVRQGRNPAAVQESAFDSLARLGIPLDVERMCRGLLAGELSDAAWRLRARREAA